MKKEVTYYLEDTSRLKEISHSELQAWIAEMPYHQPLQMLAEIKSEMDGHKSDKDGRVYAAYFAEDYESIKNIKSKKKNQRNKNTNQLSKTINIKSNTTIEEKTIKIDSKSLPEIVHKLADETKEDSVKNEVLEENDKPEVIGQIASDLADEMLEEEILSEVLEDIITDKPATDSNENSKDNSSLEIIPIVEEEENIVMEDKMEADLNSVDTDIKTSNNDNSSLIYSETVEKENTDASEDKIDDVVSIDSEQTSNSDDHKIVVEDYSDLKKEGKRKKKKKKKSKVKKKEKDPKPKKIKKKKEKSKKSSSTKKKKKVKGIISEKKKKKKRKKGRKEIKYVIIDTAKSRKYEVDNNEELSDYTSWLLNQESINDINYERNNKAQNEMKKSKKKKAKKKKKSKTLKIAVDSIKKKNSIISESLANILALQGHKKKARKMYAKLALVLPDKKDFFEEKINALKQ